MSQALSGYRQAVTMLDRLLIEKDGEMKRLCKEQEQTQAKIRLHLSEHGIPANTDAGFQAILTIYQTLENINAQQLLNAADTTHFQHVTTNTT